MEQVKQQKNSIVKLEEENVKHQERMENFDREIKELKLNKSQIRIELKQLYQKMLTHEEYIM